MVNEVQIHLYNAPIPEEMKCKSLDIFILAIFIPRSAQYMDPHHTDSTFTVYRHTAATHCLYQHLVTHTTTTQNRKKLARTHMP